MGEHYRHLKYEDRVIISIRLKDKWPVAKIAQEIGVSRKTIYNEIKRAGYMHRNTDWTEEYRYDPDLAQKDYDWKQSAKGSKLKIDDDHELAAFIEDKIMNEDCSPKAVIRMLKNENFKTEIRSVNTIYAYIRQGVFLNLREKHLPYKGKKKKKRIVKVGKRQHGRSIELRPEHINTREDFGHWEMDCVIGKQGNKKTLLVLTERKTRYEIVEVLKRKTIKEVRKALNRLEKRYGGDFYKLFKTITVDNGAEFASQEALEKAVRRKNNRTVVYYCHPYTSCERGSNENQNKMIRRRFPKGSDFDTILTTKKAKAVEKWLNDYPRDLFDGDSASNMFYKECNKLNLKRVLQYGRDAPAS